MSCQEILEGMGKFGMLRNNHIERFQIYRSVGHANFSERQHLSTFSVPEL